MTDQTDLDMVATLEDARTVAMCEQDADTLERLLGDDLHYIHSSGNVDSKRSFIDQVRNGPLQYRSFERRNPQTMMVADATAIVTGEASMGLELGGDAFGLEIRYLGVWAKVGDAWRFVAWQSTSI